MAIRGRVAVVSPHLDDAVLSLGCAIFDATQSGSATVDIVTPLAGDPRATVPAGRWDATSGFATAGEAATARRAEDARACALVGARPRWLAFSDLQYTPPDLQALSAALAPFLQHAETILAPGYPMTNPDHELVTRAVLASAPPDAALGLYLEQPYDWWSVARRLSHPRLGRVRLRVEPPAPVASPAGPDLTWTELRPSVMAVVRKLRACRAYRSQLVNFGHFSIARVLLREARRGGEHVAWLDRG